MRLNGDIEKSEWLYELSPEQAQAVLDIFLKTSAFALEGLRISSIDLNYSQQSVVSVLRFIMSEIKSGRIVSGLGDMWFERLGYYFGETLRRTRPGLRWSIGHPDYIFKNHPVIAGFDRGEEAPVITICRNVVMSVA